MTKYISLLQTGKEIGLASIDPALDGELLTLKDMMDFVITRGYKGLKPYICKGHDGIYEGGSEPSFGWLSPESIRFDGNVLYATPEFVDDGLVEEIEAGRYSKLSIEYSWLNYGNTLLFDSNGKRVGDNLALYRLLVLQDDLLFDSGGNELRLGDVFKVFLKGVAVLGRSTPAYPQFDLSIKRNMKDSTNELSKFYISKKELLIMDNEDLSISGAASGSVDEVVTSNNDISISSVTSKKKKKRSKSLADKRSVDAGVSSSTDVVNSSFLRDAYDDHLEVFKRSIRDLNSQLEALRSVNVSLEEDNKSLAMKLPLLQLRCDQLEVYNLWLSYKNDGRLRREDLVGYDFDLDERLGVLRTITDPIQRRLKKREIEIESVCSGVFFQDFHNGNRDYKDSLIRNIERKPILVSDVSKLGDDAIDIGLKDSLVDEGKGSSYLYQRTRELALRDGIDTNSPDFDIEYYRSLARSEIMNRRS